MTKSSNFLFAFLIKDEFEWENCKEDRDTTQQRCNKVINKVICEELYLLADMSPELIQGVELLTGEWGTTGSTILWRFTDHEGNQKTSKDVLESVDKENKTVVFKKIGGDLFEQFKTLNYIYNGDVENNYVVWTIEYEKLRADVADPEWMGDSCVKLMKDIENYHLQGQ